MFGVLLALIVSLVAIAGAGVAGHFARRASNEVASLGRRLAGVEFTLDMVRADLGRLHEYDVEVWRAMGRPSTMGEAGEARGRSGWGRSRSRSRSRGGGQSSRGDAAAMRTIRERLAQQLPHG